ncbi:MAG: twin-arginine translocase TatA/TatE family subunit [Anaerolineaceae bacterium]|nr:MAG: twin-arginine translocase TatA/TatE family subunit [Anaerolineaceae bacterium]
MHLGYLEIFALLILVLLLFGPGRIAKVAGELGQGIKAFKDGLSGSKSGTKSTQNENPEEKQVDNQEEKQDQ